MAKFTIQPHGRLQEWIAHEKGYFRDAGLDYEFRGGLSAERKKEVDATGKTVDVFSGAFESYEQGKGSKGIKSDISCACHWAVNQASSQQIGRMWGKYLVARDHRLPALRDVHLLMNVLHRDLLVSARSLALKREQALLIGG